MRGDTTAMHALWPALYLSQFATSLPETTMIAPARNLGRSLACILAVLLTGGLATAAPGDLDPTFGVGGVVTTSIGGGTDRASSVGIQSDGKIVAAGRSWNGSNYDFALVRYDSEGSLDATFGSNGKVTTAIGGSDAFANSVAVQADGKIVVAGWAYNSRDSDFAVARYQSNGSLDTSFDSDGKLTTAIGASYDTANSVALQADGKIVVAGTSRSSSDYSDDFALARYNSDGSLDATFGSNGKVTTAIGTSTDVGQSVAVQADGKIVVAGYSFSGGRKFAVARYNTDGSLDISFGSDGRVTTGATGYSYSMILQPDGKIIVVGDPDFSLVRYNSNGSLDTSFGGDGNVNTTIGPSSDTNSDAALAVALQPDGKIVVTGWVWADNSSDRDFALARYDSDGSLDTSFHYDGRVTTMIGASTDVGQSVVVQLDGKIVVAGYSSNGGDYDFALARYEGGASLCGSEAVDSGQQCDDGNTNECRYVMVSAVGRGYGNLARCYERILRENSTRTMEECEARVLSRLRRRFEPAGEECCSEVNPEHVLDEVIVRLAEYYAEFSPVCPNPTATPAPTPSQSPSPVPTRTPYSPTPPPLPTATPAPTRALGVCLDGYFDSAYEACDASTSEGYFCTVSTGSRRCSDSCECAWDDPTPRPTPTATPVPTARPLGVCDDGHFDQGYEACDFSAEPYPIGVCPRGLDGSYVYCRDCQCVAPTPMPGPTSTPYNACGDGYFDWRYEECDGSSSFGETCSFNYSCSPTCQCENTGQPICGNDYLEAGEECERDQHCPYFPTSRCIACRCER